MGLLPVGLLVALSSVFSDKLVDHFGTGPIIAVTTTAMSIGYLLFLRVNTHPPYLTIILPAVLLVGIGWIGFPSINIQATAGIDDDEQGLAAGVLQTSMQVGAAIVLAVNTAIISSSNHGDGSPSAMLASYRPGLIFAGVVSIAGALVALTHFLRKRPAARPVGQNEPDEEPELAAA
jgi:MFS family permease